MNILFGAFLLIIGFLLAIGTIRELSKTTSRDFISANNIKILFAELILIGIGIYTLLS